MRLLNCITHLQGKSLCSNNTFNFNLINKQPFHWHSPVFHRESRVFHANSMRLSNTELPGNGAGSWLELDGLKTLNTETCRTTAATDRPLDTAVIYTGTVYTRVVYTPADYTAADCMEVGQTRGGCHGRVASWTTGHGTQARQQRGLRTEGDACCRLCLINLA